MIFRRFPRDAMFANLERSRSTLNREHERFFGVGIAYFRPGGRLHIRAWLTYNMVARMAGVLGMTLRDHARRRR